MIISFAWFAVAGLSLDEPYGRVQELVFFVTPSGILDGVHLRIGLTHSFVYYSGCDVISTDGTS